LFDLKIPFGRVNPFEKGGIKKESFFSFSLADKQNF